MASRKPDSSEAQLAYYFSINHDKVEYAFETFERTQAINIADIRAFADQENKRQSPPPYIVGIVSELIAQREIPKIFEFTLQYVATCPDRKKLRDIAISYDVVLCGDKTLRSATFEVLSEPDVAGEGFFGGQLQPIFEKIDPTRKGLESIPLFWRSAGFIDHEIEILGYQKGNGGGVTLEARCTVTFRRAHHGEYASAYMLPRFPGRSGGKSFPVVLARHALAEKKNMGGKEGPIKVTRSLSHVVKQNLEALELAMSQPGPKIVFIHGEPGSGKEGMASAIHGGSRLDRIEGEPAKFVPRSVAGMTLDQFKREIMGEEKDGILIPGLITKAEGGTIFLDEFDKLHKDAGDAYSELLRVWEAGEFVPVNGRESKEAKKLNWVVAGAFTSERSASDLPPDIWSRFSTQIAIQNPISSPFVSGDAPSEYIHGLVFSFMLSRAIDKTERAGTKKSIDALMDPQNRIDKIAREILFAKFVPKEVKAESIEAKRKKEEEAVREEKENRLEPSQLINLISIVLSKYLGTYWNFSLKLRNPKACNSVENTLIRSHRNRLEYDDFCIPRTKTPRNEYKLDTLFPDVNFEHLLQHYDELSIYHVDRCYDSIRSVRQACSVIFDRVLELAIQRVGTGKATDVDEIRKVLNEAFTTVDLARRGTGLERLLDQRHLKDLRFGENGVVHPRFLKKIADACSAL